MTIFICDGEHLLMDKVTLLEYKPGDYNLKAPPKGELGGHYENKSKLTLLDPEKSAMSWGVGIKLFTGVGTIDPTWDKIMYTTGVDLQHIFTADIYWKFLNRDMRLIWLDAEDTLNQIYFDDTAQVMRATEAKQAKYKAGHLTIEGYNADEIVAFQQTNNVKLTALEAMVFSQTLTNRLGRRFDYYHIPTGKITYDCDLSDRQRDMIMDKIEGRMKLARRYESVYLLNTADGK